MDDYRDEIAELRRQNNMLHQELANQKTRVEASYIATMSILDLLMKNLEANGAIDRAALAWDFVRAVAAADGLPDADHPAAVLGRALFRKFIDGMPEPKAEIERMTVSETMN